MATFIPAFSTLGCPDLTLEQVLTLAHKHQIKAIDLRSLGGTLELPSYLEKVFRSPEELATKLRHEQVRIIAFGTSLMTIGSTLAAREDFLQFVPWAEALGVPWLRVFDGGKSADAAELAEAVATVNWWRMLRAKNRWKTDIMVETHDSLVTTAAIQRFLAAAPGTAIRWDTHHTWRKGGEDPVVTWRYIKKHVVFVDATDSISKPSANGPYTYVLPGDGEFPMAALHVLLRAEFDGVVSLEWQRQWHPELPPLDDALTAWARLRWVTF